MAGIGNQVVQAIAGILLVKFGHKAHMLVTEFGIGVLKNLAANLIQGAIGGGISAIPGVTGQMQSATLFEGV